MFGSSLTKFHYTPSVPYKLSGEDSKIARERRKEQYEKLRAIGYRNQYFQFRDGDKIGRARAKAQCEALVACLMTRVGFHLDVSEGCFL